MCRRFSIWSGIICLFWLTAPCGATRSVDWRQLHFEDLQGTPTAFFVLVVAVHVQEELAQEYADSLASGNEWWCITAILDNSSILTGYVERVDSFTADVAKRAREGDSTSTPGTRLPVDSAAMDRFGAVVLSHSGRSWDFWRRVAHLGAAVENYGFQDSVDREALRVFGEMKSAFKPLLRPQDPLGLGLGE